MKNLWNLAGAALAMTVAGAAMGQWTTSGTDIYNSNAGEVGIGVIAPSQSKLEVQSAGGYPYGTIFAKDTATSGSVRAIWGQTASTSGWAVTGYSTASTGSTMGVVGQAVSVDGIGVLGYVPSLFGETTGVYGWAKSPLGHAVHAYADSATGGAVGVYSEVLSPDGWGIYSYADKNYTSGKLGVGADPTAKLHVYGTVRFEALPAANTNSTLVTMDASGNVGSRKAPFMNGVKDFVAVGSTSWVVPTGITKIRAKLWGGGGGGDGSGLYKSGGSGAYIDAFLDVTPGETLTMVVGDYGALNDSGEASMITRSLTQLLVAGGGMRGTTDVGQPTSEGGVATINSGSGLARNGHLGLSPIEFTQPPYPGPFVTHPLSTIEWQFSAGTGGKSSGKGWPGAILIEW